MDTKDIKKVELHIHLDGSLRLETVLELSKKDGVCLPSQEAVDLRRYLSVTSEDKNLVDYLKKFELPLKVMQSRENLTRCSYEVVEDLANQGDIYAELRFAPHLHTNGGLSLEEVVLSVLEGMKAANEKYKIYSTLILCVMRHMPPEIGMELVELAKKLADKGVSGIDLAGDESHSASLFENIFSRAKELGVPFTIHAGEAEGADSVREAIELGAQRIGHGIRAIEDPEVIELIKKNGICLENCPISNYQTKAIEDFTKYPTKAFLEQGILVNLSTDNRTVSHTSYEKEASFLEECTGISRDQLVKMNENGIKAAFISESKKQELLKKLY